MEGLRDIQGLDQITAWPLALGWWMVIALSFAGISILLWYGVAKLKYRRSWQYQSMCALKQIEQNVEQDPKAALQKLAIELRYIAMQYAERESCASLIGKPWLEWLQQNDPQGFAWQDQGLLLVNAQYMPELNMHDSAQIKSLSNAAKGWVRKC